jgi:hypothetical protein
VRNKDLKKSEPAPVAAQTSKPVVVSYPQAIGAFQLLVHISHREKRKKKKLLSCKNSSGMNGRKRWNVYASTKWSASICILLLCIS